MSNIEETLETYGVKKHMVFTKPDPRGDEYGLLEISIVATSGGTQVTVRPPNLDRYTMFFPSHPDFLNWLEHTL